MRHSSVFKLPAAQEQYSPRTEGGQLVGTVDRVGTGLWLKCCPLCGSLHTLAANVQVGQVYAPPCDNMRTHHPTVYQAWADRHNPTGQRTVILRDRQPVIIPLTVPDEHGSERVEAA